MALGPFLMGADTMGFFVAALFFLRFWRRTGDFLFAAFSVSFLLLALNQGLVALSAIPSEEKGWFYLLRLAAFTLLIVAIVRKNMESKRKTF